MAIWGERNVRCMIVYANMLSDAWKNVYQDFKFLKAWWRNFIREIKNLKILRTELKIKYFNLRFYFKEYSHGLEHLLKIIEF